MEWEKGAAAHLAGQVKRRRIDYHVKQYVVRDSVRSGAQASSSSATRSLSGVHASTGVRWTQGELAAFRATCRLSFNSHMSLGLTVDATRLGKPAKEILCGYITNPGAQRHAALLPQACLMGCGPRDGFHATPYSDKQSFSALALVRFFCGA